MSSKGGPQSKTILHFLIFPIPDTRFRLPCRIPFGGFILLSQSLELLIFQHLRLTTESCVQSHIFWWCPFKKHTLPFCGDFFFSSSLMLEGSKESIECSRHKVNGRVAKCSSFMRARSHKKGAADATIPLSLFFCKESGSCSTIVSWKIALKDKWYLLLYLSILHQTRKNGCGWKQEA